MKNIPKKQFKLKFKKGKTIVFIDYANIKAWAREKELAFDMQVLYQTLKDSGVEKILFYYGTDQKNPGSFSFLRKMREIGFEVITKPVKYFKISLLNLLQRRINQTLLQQLSNQTRRILLKEVKQLEKKNIRLLSPKANFDVEITLDMVLFEKKFNSFILFSGDGDFAPIIKYLKSKNKKTLVVSGKKYLSGELIEAADKFLTLERFSQKTKNLLLKKPNPQSGFGRKVRVGYHTKRNLSRGRKRTRKGKNVTRGAKNGKN